MRCLNSCWRVSLGRVKKEQVRATMGRRVQVQMLKEDRKLKVDKLESYLYMVCLGLSGEEEEASLASTKCKHEEPSHQGPFDITT